MAGNTKRKAKQADNYAKARAADTARTNANKGQNVAAGTFNGKTVGGYTESRVTAREAAREAVRDAD